MKTRTFNHFLQVTVIFLMMVFGQEMINVYGLFSWQSIIGAILILPGLQFMSSGIDSWNKFFDDHIYESDDKGN